MRARLRPALLSLLVLAGAFALGGCNEEELEEGSTLVIDDDRTTAPTLTVFYALGSGTPLSTTIGAGTTSRALTVANGTYTVTFDDDGTAGVSAGDTVKTGDVVQSGRTTTVEYAGEDKANVIGPNLQANG
jgi:outer membrane protein assembly factor BamE (lipoprotein component of BamABCDE complex)